MPMFLVFVDSVTAYAIYMSLFVSVLFSKLEEKGIFNGYTWIHSGKRIKTIFFFTHTPTTHSHIYRTESSHYYAKNEHQSILVALNLCDNMACNN